MPEIHLKQPSFTYSACGQFTKTKKELKSLCKLEIQTLSIKMNLINHVFNMIRLMANQASKLIYFIQQKRKQSDKAFRDKTFKIESNPKYDGYQRGSATMVYKFFDNTSSGTGIVNEPNYQLANVLQKPIIRKF